MSFCDPLTFSKGFNQKITIKPKKRIELNHDRYVLKESNYLYQEVYVWKERDYNQSYVFESMNKSIPIDTLKFNSIEYFKVDNNRRINLGCLIGFIPIGIVFQLERQKIKRIHESWRNDYIYSEFLIAVFTPFLINPQMAISSITIGGTIGLIGAKTRKKLKSKEGIVGINGWNIVLN